MFVQKTSLTYCKHINLNSSIVSTCFVIYPKFCFKSLKNISKQESPRRQTHKRRKFMSIFRKRRQKQSHFSFSSKVAILKEAKKRCDKIKRSGSFSFPLQRRDLGNWRNKIDTHLICDSLSRCWKLRLKTDSVKFDKEI